MGVWKPINKEVGVGAAHIRALHGLTFGGPGWVGPCVRRYRKVLSVRNALCIVPILFFLSFSRCHSPQGDAMPTDNSGMFSRERERISRSFKNKGRFFIVFMPSVNPSSQVSLVAIFCEGNSRNRL